MVYKLLKVYVIASNHHNIPSSDNGINSSWQVAF